MKGKNKYNSVYEPLDLKLEARLSPKELRQHGDRIRFVTHFLIMNKILNRREAYDGWVLGTQPCLASCAIYELPPHA